MTRSAPNSNVICGLHSLGGSKGASSGSGSPMLPVKTPKVPDKASKKDHPKSDKNKDHHSTKDSKSSEQAASEHASSSKAKTQADTGKKPIQKFAKIKK